MESPDFDVVIERCFAHFRYPDDIEPTPFIEALRLVWNARGAADIAKTTTILTTAGAGASVPSVTKIIDSALRSLDR